MLTFSAPCRLGLMAMIVAAATSPALAQPNRSAPLVPATKSGNAATPGPLARSQRLSELLNSTVTLSSGTAAGEIVDVVIGPAGNVDYLVANSQDRLYAIPYEAAVVDSVKHDVRLPLTVAEFNSMLFFTVRTWPDFDDRDYRLRLARLFWLTDDARLSRRVAPASDTVPVAPGERAIDPVRAIANTATVPGRTHGVPLPGATETGVRGRGTGTGTGAAAIGGAGAAGAPSGAAAGANKPIPSGPQAPQRP
jgi:hypothetical protein